METEMEKLVKEKEKTTEMAIFPLDDVPITSIPTATPKTTGSLGGTEQLAKAMENMTIRTTKIKKLEAEINTLKDLKKRSDNAHEIEIQRAQKQIQKLIRATSEASIGHTIGQAKEIIWTSIIDSINEIQPSIQIILE